MARPAPKWPEKVAQLMRSPAAQPLLSELAHGNIAHNPAKEELLFRLAQLLTAEFPLVNETKHLLPSDAALSRKAAAVLNLLVQPLSPSSISQQQLLPRGQHDQELEDVWPILLHDVCCAVVVALYCLHVSFAKSSDEANGTQFQFPSSSQGE